tara:strand:+ start:4380 stop:4559 length:180 start_codon:yes stop_codon:yes gene_type:complete
MNSFFEQNASLFLDNQKLIADFQKIMTFEKFSKHHMLHEAGKICNNMYMITSGIARVFY